MLALVLSAAIGLVGPPRTVGMDAVELVAGREVAGQEALQVEHEGHRYLFATEASRAAFLARPGTYEVQLGGACARMGPLSGLGRTDLFAVHDGRLYLFASEACRSTFLADPEALLERADAAPAPSPEEARRGAAVLERALAAMGGRAAVRGLTSLRLAQSQRVRSGGREYTHRQAWTFRFPNGLHVVDAWDEREWSMTLAGERGWFGGADARPMVQSQREAMERELLHDPIVLLRLFAEGGLTVRFDGTEGGTDLVEAHGLGGRVVAARYRGRGPGSKIVATEARFGGFREQAGVWVPTRVEVYSLGAEKPHTVRECAEVRANVADDTAVFEPPTP